MGAEADPKIRLLHVQPEPLSAGHGYGMWFKLRKFPVNLLLYHGWQDFGRGL
jgi:hypothetical protein